MTPPHLLGSKEAGRRTLKRVLLRLAGFGLVVNLGFLLANGPDRAMLFFLSLMCIASILLLAVAPSSAHRNRIRALAKQRKNEPGDAFLAAFDPDAVDPSIPQTVLTCFQEYLARIAPSFPLHPNDRIFGMLVEDDDDFVLDMVKRLEASTGRSFHGLEHNPHYVPNPAAGDLVLILNAQPKRT